MTEFTPTETLSDLDDDGTMVENVAALHDAVVGHRIVKVEKVKVADRRWFQPSEELRITLDTGRVVTLTDTEDCCAYTELREFLIHADMVDHIITGVRTSNQYETWSIFADMGDVLELTVDWSAGNPYWYGYGFQINVIDALEATS